MLKVNKLLLISLFITGQAFAEESFMVKIAKQASDLCDFNNIIGMLIAVPGRVGAEAKKFVESPKFDDIHATVQDLKQSAEANFNHALDYSEKTLVSVGQVIEKAAETIPPKVNELTNAAKNNPYKTIVILGGILAVCKIAKDSLNSKKDNDGKTTVGFTITGHVSTPQPFKLAAGVASIYCAYKMKNNILNLFKNNTI